MTASDRSGEHGARLGSVEGPVTLQALANELGLHPSTVSRALSGSAATRAGVAEATVRRAQELAQRVGYSPDPAGAALRTRRSKTIGILVPRLTDIVLATIYEGIDDFFSGAGYRSVVANTRDDPSLQRIRLEAFLASRVEGLILGDARSDVGLPEIVADRRVPLVLVSRRLRGHVSVTTDDFLGGRIAARHIAECGHKLVGIIAGEPYASTGIERTNGFRAEMASLDLPVRDEYVRNSRFDVEGGRDATRYLLDLHPRPTAIFAVNDFAAIGAMGMARDAGFIVGSDLAIMGYNDVSIAAQMPVGLSTIHSPMFEMGSVAAELLSMMIAGQSVRSRRLPPELVARASTLGSV